MSSRFPYNDPQGWQVQIAGINVAQTVVRVMLRGLKTAVKLDKKPAVGRNGASLTFQGRDLAEFSVELSAWNETGWQIVEAITAIAFQAKGDAIGVYHPLLAAREVTSMAVESIDGPHFDGGMMTVTLACVQWAKPAKVSVSAASKAAKLTVPIPGTEFRPPSEASRPPSPAATKPTP